MTREFGTLSDDDLERLRNSPRHVLASWIKGQLLGYGEGPHVVTPRDGDIADGIMTMIAPGWNEERRERMSKAVDSLVSNWTETTDHDLQFLGGLLWLVTGLDLTAPRALLRHLDGDLKGTACRFGDVHALALGAALNPTRRQETHLLHILKRDVRDARYSAICAVALLERDPQHAADFLPTLINVGANHPQQVHLESLLRMAFTMLTAELLLDSLRRAVGMKMPASRRRLPEPISEDGRKALVSVCDRCPEVHVDWGYGGVTRIVMLSATNSNHVPLPVPLSTAAWRELNHAVPEGYSSGSEDLAILLARPLVLSSWGIEESVRNVFN